MFYIMKTCNINKRKIENLKETNIIFLDIIRDRYLIFYIFSHSYNIYCYILFIINK